MKQNNSDYNLDEFFGDEEEVIEEANEIKMRNKVAYDGEQESLRVQCEIEDGYENGTGFDLKYIPINHIGITTNRIRKENNVEALVRSIKSTGLLKPIEVMPAFTEGQYILLDGWRRLNACAKAGKKMVPVIVNHKISTTEIPLIETILNQSLDYTVKEKLDAIDYFEKQKGIFNADMIEYLLQMETGDYTKLKDVMNDNDHDIVEKLLSGEWDIGTAFKKLEARRKKESAVEKENRKADKVYGNTEESGADLIEGSGELASDGSLTDEQIEQLAINADEIDLNINEKSINQMIEEGKNIEGYQAHKQKPGEREFINPTIKKAVMQRDKATCQCCKHGGEEYVDVLDFHHVLPVFLGGEDSKENAVMLCVACHRLVHLYSTGDLVISKDLLAESFEDVVDKDKFVRDEEREKLTEEQQMEIAEYRWRDEQKRFKRIIYLGTVIRKGIAAKGMNKEEYKKQHSNARVGRRMPGKNSSQEEI